MISQFLPNPFLYGFSETYQGQLFLRRDVEQIMKYAVKVWIENPITITGEISFPVLTQSLL